jgi:hypothetical protein
MPISAWKPMTSTPAAGYFKPSVIVEPSGVVDVTYSVTTSDASAGPWPSTLYSEEFSASGKLIQKPKVVAKYTDVYQAPDGATFDISYEGTDLSSTKRAVFWTAPVDGYAHDQTTIEMQLLNAKTGAKLTKAPVTLALLGKGTKVTDLYTAGLSGLPGFGKNFMICYSTYNPISGAAQIRYEEFSDAGKALKGGVISSFHDTYHHGVAFGSWFVSGNSSKRCYLEEDFAEGDVSTVTVSTFGVNGSAGPFHLNVHLAGPQGQFVGRLDGYSFERPGTLHTKDNYGVLTQTFQYNNDADYEIALETVSAAGKITHKTEFSIIAPEGNGTLSARICHVGNGDLVVGFNDGSNSYLQEYNSRLQTVGSAYALPDSTADLVSVVSLTGDRFEAFWRQDGSSLTSGVLHSQIFTATA